MSPTGKTTVWQYPKCSTCRNALKWMTGKGVAFESIDLVAHPPSASQLRDLWKRSGLPLAKFFNTSGESYRAGGFKEKLKTMSDAEAINRLRSFSQVSRR